MRNWTRLFDDNELAAANESGALAFEIVKDWCDYYEREVYGVLFETRQRYQQTPTEQNSRLLSKSFILEDVLAGIRPILLKIPYYSEDDLYLETECLFEFLDKLDWTLVTDMQHELWSQS